MPRRPRLAAGDLAYPVLNRRVGRLPLFEKPADYAAFETILAEAHAQTRLRIAAYCVMPNHWHLLLWPRHDGELSAVLRWITVTHTQRWHAHHHTAGTGPVYQGRFKSFPVQTDEHFLTDCALCGAPCAASEARQAGGGLAGVESLAMRSGRRQDDDVAQRLARRAASGLGGAGASPTDSFGAGSDSDERATGAAARGRALNKDSDPFSPSGSTRPGLLTREVAVNTSPGEDEQGFAFLRFHRHVHKCR